MTYCSQVHSARFNSLKRHALEIFKRHGGWLTAPQWAIEADFYPIRAAYSYLLRLHRFGLLERRRMPNAVIYRLSLRGEARLEWLSSNL
jgi:hypothetical protein